MGGIGKHKKNFLLSLLGAWAHFAGKATFRNLSRYTSINERTMARNFSEEFYFATFNKQAIEHALPRGREMIVAFDQTFVKKSGKKTYGVEFFWNGCRSKSEQGLEVGVVAMVDVSGKRAYPLYAQQTPTKQEIKDMFGANKSSRMDSYLHTLRKCREKFPYDPKTVVMDGGLSNKKMVDGIDEMGLSVVGKLRHDADLRYLYNGMHTKKTWSTSTLCR